MRQRHWRSVLAAAAFSGAVAAHLAAQMFVTTGRDTLRTLAGVEIIVESLDPEVARAGLTTTAIRAVAERRLRTAGIVVFDSQTANTSAAKPYLYIHLNALEIQDRGLLAVAVQVHLRQTVQALSTGSNIVNAMTWDSHTVVSVPAKDVRELTGEIGEHVDRFIEDWKSVH